MSNSRVITADFEYFAPGNVVEALSVMAGGNVKPIAGGTDLLNNIKTEGLNPPTLMNVLSIGELDYIRKNGRGSVSGSGSGNGKLTIGAAARLRDIECAREIVDRFPALRESINVIGGTQIRNMATLAGNVCNASPGADTPPVMIVLGAEVTVCKAGPNGKPECRTLPMEDMFLGVKKTVLGPDELVTEIAIPFPPENSGQSFRRLARVRLDIAKINCAVYLEKENGAVKTVRICFGSVAQTPVRIKSVEKLVSGKALDETVVSEAAEAVADDIKPITDVRSTAEYRKQVAPTMLAEALLEAWNRAGE